MNLTKLEFISKAISLTTFDFQRKTYVQTNTSKFGVGYLLYQIDENDISYVMSLGSTYLKLKYSLLTLNDLEAIVMIFALKKPEYYIKGCSKTTFITHCMGIANTVSKPLSDIENHRLQCLFIQLSNISYAIEHLHGKKLHCADALS